MLTVEQQDAILHEAFGDGEIVRVESGYSSVLYLPSVQGVPVSRTLAPDAAPVVAPETIDIFSMVHEPTGALFRVGVSKRNGTILLRDVRYPVRDPFMVGL